MEFIIDGKWKLCECLGRGSFGALYVGRSIKSNEQVAIKLESLKATQLCLQYEALIYQNLRSGGKQRLLHCSRVPSCVLGGRPG